MPLAAVESSGITFTELTRITSTNLSAAPRPTFGRNVALNSNVLVIASPSVTAASMPIAGAAWVFRPDPGEPTGWREDQQLFSAPPIRSDAFGRTLALDGSTLVVGSARAIHIFEPRDGLDSPFVRVAQFNFSVVTSVAIHGDTLVVGATADDQRATEAGAAFVFQRNPGPWKLVRKLTAGDAAAYDHFGSQVAVRGDTIVVSASDKDVTGVNSGAVYVFERHAEGENRWGETQRLAEGVDANHAFGSSMAMEGRILAVGAHDAYGSQAGAAYIYHRNPGSGDPWIRAQTLSADNNNSLNQFGASIALNAGVLLVGAPGDFEVAYNSGAAYLFEETSATTNAWESRGKLFPTVNQGGFATANRVALHGNTGVLSAHAENNDTGAAYIFHVNRPFDFGDAPSAHGYPTTFAQNAARHVVPPEGATLYLGNTPPDTEIDGQPHPSAIGDVVSGSVEEDGVRFDSVLVSGSDASLTVTAHSEGFFSGWIDFDRDGDWDTVNERVLADVQLTDGPALLTFNVPGNAASGVTFARFRLSNQNGLTPIGEAPDGEVEDYLLVINSNAPPVATPDHYIVYEDQLVTGQVILDDTGNGPDTDPDGDAFRAVLLQSPVESYPFTFRSDGFFQYRPSPDFRGSDSFTYAITDGGIQSAPAVVSLTIVPVNDPPVFNMKTNLELSKISGFRAIARWASGISPGAAHESDQALGFLLTNDNPELFEQQPAIAPDGSLSLEPSMTHSGTATVTVVLQDDGGTANGGSDMSMPQRFTIRVLEFEPVELQPLNAPDPNGSYFGDVLAIDDRTLAVGDVGKRLLHIYNLPSRIPVRTMEILAKTLALDGDTLVVNNLVLGRNQDGPDQWGLVKALPAAGDSAAVLGDVIALGFRTATSNTGLVRIYGRNQGEPDAWGETQVLTADDAAVNAYFGRSLALQWETLVVGSLNAAYVFQRDGSGSNTWVQTRKLRPSVPTASFGVSVAIDGNVIAVGASGFENDPGRVFIFERHHGGADSWGESAYATGGPGYGGQVAISGDILIATAGSSPYTVYRVQINHRNQDGAGAWGLVRRLPSMPNYLGRHSIAADDATLAIGSIQSYITPWYVTLQLYGLSVTPPLSIERSATDLILAWPNVPGATYGIQQALGPDFGQWFFPPDSTNNPFIIPFPADSSIFRLRTGP